MKSFCLAYDHMGLVLALMVFWLCNSNSLLVQPSPERWHFFCLCIGRFLFGFSPWGHNCRVLLRHTRIRSRAYLILLLVVKSSHRIWLRLLWQGSHTALLYLLQWKNHYGNELTINVLTVLFMAFSSTCSYIPWQKREDTVSSPREFWIVSS